MSVFTFDPGKFTLIVGGFPIGGFADGTAIKVSRTNQAYTKHTGLDGVVSRVRSRDKSGEITITLAQTSPSNDVMSAFALADELNDAGVVPVLVKDGNGRSVALSGYAWIRKLPDQDYGKEISNREWVMDTADLDIFVGGSTAS
jgi:hypothetical protein